MSPHETLFRLEATQHLERSVVDHTPLCRFTVYDFPGDFYGPDVGPESLETSQQNSWLESPESLNNISNEIETVQDNVFERATALIFVLDAQDEPYDHVLQHFTETVKRAALANPHIAIEVFINKVDGELFLSDEAKYDCRRDVMQQVTDDLADAGVMRDSVPISYHLTSIYDHSVFEAFSRVVQKLIPQLPTLENLLNALVSSCSMEKAYLFDIATKLYISTDSSPVDMQTVELCSDMIDVVLDVSGIYGLSGGALTDSQILGDGPTDFDSLSGNVVPSGEIGSLNSGDAVHGKNGVIATEEMDARVGETHSQFADDNVALDDCKDEKDELVGTLIRQEAGDIEGTHRNPIEEDTDSAYDSKSACVIRLNGMILYLREVDTMLALVCLTRAENFRKKSLINYNIGCLKKALRALVQPIQV